MRTNTEYALLEEALKKVSDHNARLENENEELKRDLEECEFMLNHFLERANLSQWGDGLSLPMSGKTDKVATRARLKELYANSLVTDKEG